MKNKFVAALVSLVIALGLWIYVITVVSPGSEDTFANIPVVLRNEEALTARGLMIVTEDIPTVTLRLSGNRSDLNKLNPSNITLIANLSGIYSPGVQQLSYEILYPGDIASNAFVEESRSPGRITIEVERRVTKEVPVVLAFSELPSEDYIADTQNPVLDYPNVTITGPAPVIEQITQAVIQVDLADRTESVDEAMAFTLCDEAGEAVDAHLVVTDVGKVNVAVKIQRIKEIPLTVTVIDGGGATSETSTVEIEPQTIRIAGSDILLEQLPELNLGTINLAEQTEASNFVSFPIKLPEGVENLAGVQEAQITVQFPNLRTTTYKVTDIQAINVPEGMEADIITQELQVRIRGPKEVMEQLKDTDISVTVDLAGAAQGASTVKPTIVLPEAFAQADAVGSYSVSVDLKQGG